HIGADACPSLMAKLGDSTFKNQIGLVRVLGNIDGTPAELPGQLTPFLSSSDSDLRLAAMKALARKGEPSVAPVIAALSSDNHTAQVAAEQVLADIGPAAKAAVPNLILLLKSDDATVRANAAHALGNMHSAASAAVPALREALKDPDPDVVERAR